MCPYSMSSRPFEARLVSSRPWKTVGRGFCRSTTGVTLMAHLPSTPQRQSISGTGVGNRASHIVADVGNSLVES